MGFWPREIDKKPRGGAFLKNGPGFQIFFPRETRNWWETVWEKKEKTAGPKMENTLLTNPFGRNCQGHGEGFHCKSSPLLRDEM